MQGHRPLCPRCNEALARADYGVDGVWSCFYCRGTWVPAATTTGLMERKRRNYVVQVASTDAALRLTCPECEGTSFKSLTINSSVAHRCDAGCGAFFPQNELEQLIPRESSYEGLVVGGAIVEMAASILLATIVSS
jgi:Zn-finger nucleic acid-binding protein